MRQYYPEYHFRPEKNWMNDPNGLIFFEGKYHMFYQYNPNGDQWGTIHWGHAVSRDLIHWEHLPIALFPSTEEGEIHCYSGCAVVKEGIPYLFYTSVGEGKRGPETGAQQWSAVSYDHMNSFIKKGRPAIPEELNGNHRIEMWRDPFLWKEEQWYAILGGTENGKGCLVLYSSEDLEHWKFLNKIYESDKYWLVECPNMIPLGENRYLILYSPLDSVHYMVAELDKSDWKLRILKEGIFDHSILKTGFYAPNTYLNDPKGRILIIGWISEADRASLKEVHGWAGMQSLPREVTVDAKGKLGIRPSEECKMLRKKLLYNQMNVRDTELKVGDTRTAELFIKAFVGSCGRLEIRLFADADGEEETRLWYDSSTKLLVLDRESSSLYPEVGKQEIAVALEPGNMLELRIFLDSSSVEVFINDRETITARVYPQKQESKEIWVRPTDGIVVEELRVWEIDKL